MSIRYYHHKSIDFDKWEYCVSNSLNACVYGHVWYLNNISLTWDGIVLGDYEAVMPVFCDVDRMYLPYSMLWTGIYSKEILTPKVCQMFVDFIDQRFKYVNIAFDKYFISNSVNVKGRLQNEYVYQLDTFKGISHIEVQNLVGAVNYNRYSCRDHIPNTIRAVIYSDFLDIDKTLSFKTAMNLKNLANRSVTNKFGCYTELLERGVSVKGAALAVISDSYVFLPFFGTAHMSTDAEFGRILLLSHLVNKYFAHRPCVVTIDSRKIGISTTALEKMGFRRHQYSRYKVDMITKLTNLFKTNNRQTQISE
ncbi:MAG: hypothetical protein K6F33_09280 [Bacteroidales bacterium]|nr:hypothetical protein [Bacteroidales bacterium]